MSSASAPLRLVSNPSPPTVIGKVAPPTRKPNKEIRSREYLTSQEVDKIMAEARRRGRHGHRDATMILLAYRHGLRVSELVDLRWDQIDWKGYIHVQRLKNGNDSTQPMEGDEIRALRRLKRENPESSFIFTTERKGPLTASTFRKLIAKAGELVNADLPRPIHPHMLRHGCGFYLANKNIDTRTIQDWLGHRNIQHTVRYTQLNGDRFKGLWRE